MVWVTGEVAAARAGSPGYDCVKAGEAILSTLNILALWIDKKQQRKRQVNIKYRR